MNAPSVTNAVEFAGTTNEVKCDPTSTIGLAIETARTLLVPIHQVSNIEIRRGVGLLARILGAFERSVPGKIAPYHVEEARETINTSCNEASLQAMRARQLLYPAEVDLKDLSEPPRLLDSIGDSLIDSEIRSTVRAMPPEEKTALLVEIRAGAQPRVALALARSPLRGKFELEAAEIYGRTCEPAKRAALEVRIQGARSIIEEAQALQRAAAATTAVIDLFDSIGKGNKA